MLMTPIYSARTTLQIDREAAKVLNTDDVTPNDRSVVGEEFFQTQYGLLKSRSLAIRVTESLNLANNDFLSKMGVGDDAFKGSPQEIAAARKSLAVAIIEGKLSVEPVRGSRLVKVSFSSPDPVLSARVANAVADNFIESNLALRFESSAYARDFLEQRLKLLKPRLEESERQLVAYAASQQIINVAAAPNQTGNDTSGGATQSLTANNLVALNSSLAAAKGERIRTEQRWRQVQSTSGRSLPEVLQSPTIQQLSQSRAQLMASYQEKLSTYKPDYPLMLQLKAQIDEIDRQIQAEINNVRESLRANYNIALNQERALSQQVEGLKSSFLDLRNRSIEYTILQREVDTNRSQYEALLQRYKDVTVAGGVVSNNISVVDRAEVPEAPSKPRPLLNIALAMLMGLGLGVVAAFIAEAFDDAINAPEDVESKLDLPVLGTVAVLDHGRCSPQPAAHQRPAVGGQVDQRGVHRAELRAPRHEGVADRWRSSQSFPPPQHGGGQQCRPEQRPDQCREPGRRDPGIGVPEPVPGNLWPASAEPGGTAGGHPAQSLAGGGGRQVRPRHRRWSAGDGSGRCPDAGGDRRRYCPGHRGRRHTPRPGQDRGAQAGGGPGEAARGRADQVQRAQAVLWLRLRLRL